MTIKLNKMYKLITYLRHKIVKTYLISVLTILYLSIKGKEISFLEGLSSINNNSLRKKYL